MYLYDSDSANGIAIKVTVEEHPTVLFLGTFPKARALYGAPYFEIPRVLSKPWFHGPPIAELVEFAQRKGKAGIGGGAFDPGPFSRMLAKIALSFSIAEIGDSAFTPLVQNMILGSSKDINHLVGGSFDNPPPPEDGVLHSIRWKGETVGSKHYVVVYLRLFADLGAPIYHVVVGEAFPETVAKYSSTTNFAESLS